MSAESVLDQIKESLEGRPGQPMVLGVCRALADRFDQEVWLVRAITIVLAVFWTFPRLVAYIIRGFALKETEDRSRRFFCGLGIVIREFAEKVFGGLRDLFNGDDHRRSRGY